MAFHAFPKLIRSGFVGVDVFFVISGFLISSIIFSGLESGNFSFTEFYKRRIRRIFPALLLVMFCCYVFASVILFPSEYKQLSLHIVGGAGFVSNLILWQEAGYFDVASQNKPLLHLWSLGIEEQFYIFWPLLMFLCYKKRINFFYAVIFTTICSFAANILFIEYYKSAVFYLPVTRVWELSLGALLAYSTVKNLAFTKAQQHIKTVFKKLGWRIRISPTYIANIKSCLGIVFITIAVFAIRADALFPGWLALLPTIGACCIISAGPQAWFNRIFLSNRLAVGVGLISYPLYLWHWPLLSFGHIIEYGAPSIKARIEIILASMVLAWLTYLFIEKPVRRAKPTRMLVVLMLILASIAAASARDMVPWLVHTQEIINWRPKDNYSDQCMAKFPGQALCLETDTNKQPDVMLVGDSHAHHLFPGLSKHFAKIGKNLLLLGGPGCVPFYNVESAEPGNKDYCIAKIDQALEYAMNTPSVKTIILADRGLLYMSGHGFGEQDDTKSYIRWMQNPKMRDFSDIYAAAFKDTLTRLTKTGKQIIVTVDVPELGFQLANCITPRLFSSKELMVPCAVTKADYEARSKQYKKILANTVKQFPSVHLFTTSDYMCDKNYCYAIKDNTIFYRDSDHLSVAGSEFIADKFFKNFSKLQF